ncbi:helix-turn-helix domain-containing protein [Arthrobacter yangruifuii]|uniref:helix-turn-helix domain-containing protein n=1 Tax=Arthrobacter yangruifuii TaxID=2606616 RepID=UPI001645D29A|nr:helix-turn-helix domain-containing protein [Arthrobacter yangruifuii]
MSGETTVPVQSAVPKRTAKVSAAAVARACGVSPATVSYVMNGRPGAPGITVEDVRAATGAEFAVNGHLIRTGALTP